MFFEDLNWTKLDHVASCAPVCSEQSLTLTRVNKRFLSCPPSLHIIYIGKKHHQSPLEVEGRARTIPKETPLM